ncbi:MAG TPA: TetR family transcriptional regulator [Pseudonocardia sp.]|jgi:AcrR family transcriptional regulator
MPRPKVPLLSRSKIVEAAIELIDEEGADQLNIRKLARRLEVQGPSIYHYFTDRDEVLAAVGLTVLQEIRIPRRRSQRWTEWLVQDGLAYYRAVEAHPNIAPILLDRRTRPGAAERFNAALEQMQDAGIPPADGLALIDAVEGLALSWLAFSRAPDHIEEFGNLDKLSYPLLDVARRKHNLDENSYRRVLVALVAGFEQNYAAS